MVSVVIFVNKRDWVSLFFGLIGYINAAFKSCPLLSGFAAFNGGNIRRAIDGLLSDSEGALCTS